MKYKDPTKIAKEKAQLTQEAQKINNELIKAKSFVEILPTVDKNCMCLMSGCIAQVLSDDETLVKIYNENVGQWTGWQKMKTHKSIHAPYLEIVGDEQIFCIPTTEYYQFYVEQDKWKITDEQWENMKQYSSVFYLYSKQSRETVERINKKKEEENRNNGEHDINKGKIHETSWYSINFSHSRSIASVTRSGNVIHTDGDFVGGEWGPIEYKLIRMDEQKAYEMVASDVFKNSSLYTENNGRYVKDADEFIEEMKKGKMPAVIDSIKINLSWKGAAGMPYQLMDRLPSYIKELEKQYLSVNKKLQEIEKYESLSPKELEQLYLQDKAEKDAREKQRLFEASKKEELKLIKKEIARAKRKVIMWSLAAAILISSVLWFMIIVFIAAGYFLYPKLDDWITPKVKAKLLAEGKIKSEKQWAEEELKIAQELEKNED